LSLAGNIGGEDLGRETSMTMVGIAAFIGALVEWYDYFLYGLAASPVFIQLFFPLENRLFATLAAFATFGVGFFFVSVYLATESFREDLTAELARDPDTQSGGAGQTT
jgi:hypothetical protein